jgi:mannose-6-phosphate isomerase-like protein (cupin superfamily)
MPSRGFDTKGIAAAPVVAAPDGAKVRILCALNGGSAAVFVLEPGMVTRPVAHRTVEEVWYVTAGTGRIWRRQGEAEAVTELAPGTALTIPLGTAFQFRNDGTEPLTIFAVTMPPWPGADEAYPVEGRWRPRGVPRLRRRRDGLSRGALIPG